MSRRPGAEDGIALFVAIMALTVMLALGLGTYSFVSGQERESVSERTAESAFNLGEAALDGQTLRLSHSWPGTAAKAYPYSCTQASSEPRCPEPAGLTRTFDSPDFAVGSSWVTTVRDNGGSLAVEYDEDAANSQPSWDANGDLRLWVRAQAVVRGKRRTLAMLVTLERFTEQFPKHAITAGRFATTNSGNKVIVDTRGPSAEPAPVAVRCTVRSPSCLDYDPAKGQISPDTTQIGYQGGAALDAAAIGRLRSRATAEGSYYPTGCPANPTGVIVFVEDGDCSYGTSTGMCCNSATAPGVFIVINGTLSLGGNVTFYGIVYAANAQGTSGAVVSIGGTASIQGSVAIDGDGLLSAGSSKVNVVYDERAAGTLWSYGSAAPVKNSWREVRG
jgi:hypothetical protein